MWKALSGIALATAIVGGSVLLYSVRHRLFRPDVTRVGGTRVVLDVKGDADAVAAVLRQRFDPDGAEGVVIRPQPGRVEVDVPNGHKHDENLQRVRRLSGRPGRFRAGVLAHELDDGAALAAGKTWLVAAANRKALEDAYTKGEPLPALEGEFKGKGPAAPSSRYEWVSADVTRVSVTHGPFGGPGAVSAARASYPVAHEWPAVLGGRAAVVFTLLRLVPDGEGVSNADVVRPRVVDDPTSTSRYSLRLLLRVEGGGRRRLTDLVEKQSLTPAAEPRRAALLIDGDVLRYDYVGATLNDPTFYPVVEDRDEGEGFIALLRAPLPAGSAVKVEEERTLPGR